MLQRFKGADPMLEYEKRTSAFFRDLIGNVRRNTVYSLMQVRRGVGSCVLFVCLRTLGALI